MARLAASLALTDAALAAATARCRAFTTWWCGQVSACALAASSVPCQQQPRENPPHRTVSSSTMRLMRRIGLLTLSGLITMLSHGQRGGSQRENHSMRQSSQNKCSHGVITARWHTSEQIPHRNWRGIASLCTKSTTKRLRGIVSAQPPLVCDGSAWRRHCKCFLHQLLLARTRKTRRRPPPAPQLSSVSIPVSVGDTLFRYSYSYIA